MTKINLTLTALCFVCLFICDNVFCLDSNEIARLKGAKVDDETIQMIISEKVVETCLFTVQEIIDLRRAGISNKTIQAIIASSSSNDDAEYIEYSHNEKPLKDINTKDIIYLKNKGISDEVIQSIVSKSGNENNEEEKKAWEMLKNMDIVIDKREDY